MKKLVILLVMSIISTITLANDLEYLLITQSRVRLKGAAEYTEWTACKIPAILDSENLSIIIYTYPNIIAIDFVSTLAPIEENKDFNEIILMAEEFAGNKTLTFTITILHKEKLRIFSLDYPNGDSYQYCNSF